jgi:hypothetical protein
MKSFIVQTPLPLMIPTRVSHLSGLLLEAVGRLLAVPDGSWQRKLSPDPVFSDGTQRSAPQLLGLNVVSLHPKDLQLRVVLDLMLEKRFFSVKVLRIKIS